MTQRWHVPGHTLRAYVAERLPDSQAWSVETHIMECTPCRRRVTEAVEVSEVSATVRQVRTSLADELPRQGRVRPGTRLRKLWVLLGSADNSRGAGLLAVLCALASVFVLELFGGLSLSSSWWSDNGSILLLIAPILPALGIAVSCERLDPAREIAASTPVGGLRLVLWRTLSVCLVSLPVAAMTGAVLGEATLFSWLLPCLGVTSVTLALGSVIRLEFAAYGVALAWLAVTLGPLAADEVPLLLDRPLPLLWSGLIAVSTAVLLLRRSAFQRPAFPLR